MERYRRNILFSVLIFIFPILAVAQHETVRINIDSLNARLPKAPEEEKAGIFNQLAKANWENASDKAIHYGELALNLSQKYNDRKNEAFALLNLCQGYLYNDIYDEALNNGLKALDIYEELGDSNDIIYMLSTIGWIYYDIENADLALLYHEKVLNYYLRHENKDNIAFSYNSLGLIYGLKNEFEEALPYYQKALALSGETGNQRRKAIAHNNLGGAYMALGEYELAISHLKKAIDLKEEKASSLFLAESWNQVGGVYTKMGNFEKAMNSLEKAKGYIDHSTSNSRKEKLIDNYEFYSELYAEMGNYKKAFETLKEYANLRSQVLSEDKMSSLGEMRLLFETQKKENEIKLLEQSEKIKNLQRNVLGVGFFLLLVISYLTYSRLKYKHRKTKLEQEALKNKLDFKNTEVTTFAIHIDQRNKLLNSFLKDLEELKAGSDKGFAEKINALVNRIEQSRVVNEDIEDFQLNIENEYKDFLYNLLQKFPDLTEHEKKLAAQLRLNLSTKEIATLNSISVKSAEMARYRLRKHFELDAKDNIVEFLRTF